MATMFPAIAVDEIAEFTTPGEGRFYRFLQAALRPDADFLAWYGPDVEGREPDFVVYSPDSGLIVFEVKDWTTDQITEADPKQVRLMAGTQERQVKNPAAQVREYVNTIMRRLGTDNQLCSKVMAGKPGLPVNGGVALVNMSRQSFRQAGLDKILPEGRVLFLDDVNPHSPHSTDPSGNSLREFLRRAFPPQFPFRLDPRQLERLRALLFPVVRIEIPRRGLELAAAQDHVAALDCAQEQLARSFHTGKRLMTGPSGSGKTLILAHQAAHLTRSNAKVRRVLVTCFNLSLSNYMHRLLAAKQTPYGPDAVEVVPFYDLCGRILVEPVSHTDEKTYYELVVGEARAVLADERGARWRGYYNAILVDEGQDFTEDMVRVLLPLLHAQHGVLTVALDEQQALYTGQSVWKDCVPDARRHDLGTCYRNSVQISRFVAAKLGLPCEEKSLAGPQGPEAQEKAFADLDALCTHVTERVVALVREGCPMAEIAVLYASRRLGQQNDVPERLRDALERRGLMVTWAAEDARAKRRYDITTDTVTLSTIHSAKGLDYAHVFLVGLPPVTPGKSGYAEKLAYVGMTRARLGLELCGL